MYYGPPNRHNGPKAKWITQLYQDMNSYVPAGQHWDFLDWWEKT